MLLALYLLDLNMLYKHKKDSFHNATFWGIIKIFKFSFYKDNTKCLPSTFTETVSIIFINKNLKTKKLRVEFFFKKQS